MKTCGACGGDLTEGSCGTCGAQGDASPVGAPGLALGFVCPGCHEYNEAGVLVCASCGASLTPGGFTGFLRAASIEAAAAEQAGPEQAGPEQAGPEQAGPEQAGPEQAGPSAGTGTMIFGALRAGRAKLVLLRGLGYEGAEFRLNAPSVGAGRSRGMILFPEDPFLSDQHATFMYQGGVLLLRDEGGESGCWIGLREPTPIPARLEAAIGSCRLRLQHLTVPDEGSVVRQLGAPAPGPAVRIEEILEGDRQGRAWICSASRTTIGKEGADVWLGYDELVDDVHAEIRLDGRGATLVDLGSSTGTFMRLPPETCVPLRHLDRVRIGKQILEVRVAG